MKRILGLDLGSTSIGWALVNEAENDKEKSSIVKLGVRVNPLTTDELNNFEKGQSITTNADRTLKRGMRRNLQRYKLRREVLRDVLKKHHIITDETILSENGNRTTFETCRLRAKAATEEVTLEEFGRILLMINKKRGYKSNRKANGSDKEENGTLFDGMDIARILKEKNITPAEYYLPLYLKGKRVMPTFYLSDLQNELDRIWNKQKEYYPEILSDALKDELKNKKREAVWAICAKYFVWSQTEDVWNELEARTEQVVKEHKLEGIYSKRKREESKGQNLEWRIDALSKKLSLEQLVIVLQEMNMQIKNSSGYLNAISDRRKELFFNKQTVGQYQMKILNENPNASLKKMVFYRQDYLDEFNTLWDKQAEFHKVLTEDLKQEIRDVVIFYQRRLKSQKGLISFCEFESRQIEVEINGKKKTKTVGSRVAPRSSPLFQEFKIWQTINNIIVSFKDEDKQKTCENKFPLSLDDKQKLAKELSVRDKMSKSEVLKLIFAEPKELDLNFTTIEGNKTGNALFKAYSSILELSGHEPIDFKKPTDEIIDYVKTVFMSFNWNTEILNFSTEKDIEQQPYYELWHLLYSFEGDNTPTGNGNLVEKISNRYGFNKEYASVLANITFQDDYASLSSKAIRKILPYLKEGSLYDVACAYAGYRHSKSSLTKEEIINKVLKDKLELLPKGSLRNAVVEKILNQMVNVINSIIDVYGKPDEIRVELARELKKNAADREKMTKDIARATKLNDGYRETLLKDKDFNLSYVSHKDLLRYKLYLELKSRGFKTLYSNTYIPKEKLFSKEFDIEHIIPQALLFDDSFSNKTLELRSINIEKSNKTTYDFIKDKYGETGNTNSLDSYLSSIKALYDSKVISKTKYEKLKMSQKDLPEDFLSRDLRNSQYIAKKALSMLSDISRRVVGTIGSITDQLRQDWQLVDIMKELNWNKYEAAGKTEYVKDKDGRSIGKIIDWTKRNDHRHHAMDALTVAFTKDAFIQYFNNVSARKDTNTDTNTNTNTNADDIKKKYFKNQKAVPPIPINEFRAQAKKQLSNILISIKAKNKVVTLNVNKTKIKGRSHAVTQQTPRGQLHKETIYGSQKIYSAKEEKVNASFDENKIKLVCKAVYRNALLERLRQNDNNPKKAFTGKNSLDKNPLWLNEEKTSKVPEKVKTVMLETIYTIRKEISPDLKIDKVIDCGVRKVLLNRLQEYNNDANKAFSNLDENPIWLNEEKGISIKRVTISGINKAQPLHVKKDKEGNIISNENGESIPVDFVNTGNNHHVAVYRRPSLDKAGQIVIDENGNPKYEIDEFVIPFFEAVTRANLGLPVIDKEYKANEGWQFLFSMKQNEYFVFPNEKTGFNPKEIDLLNPDNYEAISPNLFRVQKFCYKDYYFRHHLETMVKDTNKELRDITWKQITSSSGLENMIKVRVNHIGQIISVGEY